MTLFFTDHSAVFNSPQTFEHASELSQGLVKTYIAGSTSRMLDSYIVCGVLGGTRELAYLRNFKVVADATFSGTIH